MKFKSTAELEIPKDPLDQIIGQDEAVKVAKIAAKQRRHLLFVGPPGTGKSLLAQALALHLPKPKEEISVIHNPEYPERPFVEVRTLAQAQKEERAAQQVQAKVVSAEEVPAFVAERLGFRCRNCGLLSKASEHACPSCGHDKYLQTQSFGAALMGEYLQESRPQNRVHTTRILDDNREEVIVYERYGEKIRVLDQKMLEQMEDVKKKKPRKVIVPFNRSTFIIATGASETELLGDVRHDPYGGHAQVGTQPYTRVLAGTIHEAHEGVLFVDELSTLGQLQRYLLTAMQEKKYPIVGRNPQSAGASVRVDGVPCDFIMVAASNINDIGGILPPLRSRILGNGYEVLLNITMDDNVDNRLALARFVAQEVRKDGKVPHLSAKAVGAVIGEAARRASVIDGADKSLTLRLRELSGIVRLAGDLAVSGGEKLVDERHVEYAIRKGRNIEEQLQEKYGSLWKAGARDYAAQAEKRSPKDQKEIS